MHNDFALLDSFKNGDQQAFENLVKKYKNTVFNAIYSVIGNTSEANDIAQEVFLKVYYSAGSFKRNSSFSTWIYRITVNKCLDMLRKRKRTPISLETELSKDEFFRLEDVLKSHEEDSEQKILRKEFQETIQKILNSLPEKYRIIITLKEIECLSYNEISKIMKISMHKVKVWLFRARQHLKKQLSSLKEKNDT